MAAQYKLVALDMDGTVLNDKQQISQENREAIAAAIASGVTVMFATGRGVQSVLPYIEDLGLKSPLVAVNGGEVWRKPGDLLQRALVPNDVIRRVHELAVSAGTWYWGYSVEGLFNRDKWADDIDAYQWLKFGFYEENAELLASVRKQVEEWGIFEVTNSHPSNIELNPKGISKGSGMIEVCKLLGIQMNEVIAMGDSFNDLSMITAAGLGVAMGNAQPAIKEYADIVTLTNEENGVAAVIRDYILNR